KMLWPSKTHQLGEAWQRRRGDEAWGTLFWWKGFAVCVYDGNGEGRGGLPHCTQVSERGELHVPYSKCIRRPAPGRSRRTSAGRDADGRNGGGGARRSQGRPCLRPGKASDRRGGDRCNLVNIPGRPCAADLQHPWTLVFQSPLVYRPGILP